MIYWFVAYVIGVVLAFTSFIGRLIREESQLTVQDVFYTFIVSLLSWGAYILFDEKFGEAAIRVGTWFSRVGTRIIWRKRNLGLPGGDKLQHPASLIVRTKVVKDDKPI